MAGAEKRKVVWAEKVRPRVEQEIERPQPMSPVILSGPIPEFQAQPMSSVSIAHQVDEVLGSNGFKSNSWEVGEGSSDQAKVSKGFLSAGTALGVGLKGSTCAEKLVDLPSSEPTSASNGKGLVLVQEVTPSVGNLVGMVLEGPPRASATSGLVSDVKRQIELKVPSPLKIIQALMLFVVSPAKSVGEELVDMLRCNNLMKLWFCLQRSVQQMEVFRRRFQTHWFG